MNHVKSFLYKAACAVCLLFFGYVFYRTLGNLSHMEIINASVSPVWKFFFTAIGGIFLCAFCLMTEKLFLKLPAYKRKLFLILLAVVGISLQLFVILGIRPCLRYDSLHPVDTAAALMNGQSFSDTTYYEYFSIYPHNLPLIGYIFVILKFFRFLGFSPENYVTGLQLINCLFIDLAVFGLFRLLTSQKDIRTGFRFLLLCVLNPLLYYYPVFFYTQVLCIPFISFSIILFYGLKECRNSKKGILLSILFAITLFFGTKIRILALIAPIACGIFVLLRGNFRFIKEKAFYQNLIVIAVVFLLCVTADRMLLNRLSLVTDSSAAFPAQHWLMMGFSENGSYNPEDEQFSLDFSTKEERIVEDTNVLKERIHTLGFSGIIRLWKEKLALTWSDGYDDYADNLTLARDYRMLNSYLSGGRSELLTGIMHCYHTGISLLLMLCALLAFFRKTPDCMFVIFLSVLGGMIFHLFWESGEAYSMPFALLIVAAASGGLDFPKLTQHKSSGLLLILPLTAMLGLLAMLAPVLFRQPFQIREFAAVQDLSDGDDILLKEGDVISQTFSAALPFDRLKIYSKYISGSSKPALAMLTLLDENQRIIHEELLENENSFYNAHTCQFNEIIPNDTETFTIQLTVLELPEDTEYSFLTYHTGNIDVYPNGMLLKNQLYTPNADLNFIVYRDVNKTFL